MIWFLVSFFLAGVLALPGDLALQRPTELSRRRAAEVVTELSRSIRIERAFDELDRLHGEAAGEMEAHAIRIGDALADPATPKSRLQELRAELDQAQRSAFAKQLAVRTRLRAELSAEEWRRIFPAPP